jgi:hypothetical protein
LIYRAGLTSPALLGGGYPMTQSSELAKDVLKDLITIERTLWENNADTYHDRYSAANLAIKCATYRRSNDGRKS